MFSVITSSDLCKCNRTMPYASVPRPNSHFGCTPLAVIKWGKWEHLTWCAPVCRDCRGGLVILMWNFFAVVLQSLFWTWEVSGRSSCLHCTGDFMGSTQRKCFHHFHQCPLNDDIPVAYPCKSGEVQCYSNSVSVERIFEVSGHPIYRRVCSGLS